MMGPLVFTDLYMEKGLYVVLGTLLPILGVAFVINLITYRRFEYAVRCAKSTLSVPLLHEWSKFEDTSENIGLLPQP